MGSWKQISRYFPRRCLLAGLLACLALRARRLARRCLGHTVRRWDILTRPTRVSLTRIIERQWTTDPIPASPGSWRMIG